MGCVLLHYLILQVILVNKLGRRKPKHPTSKLQIRRFRRNSLAVMRNSINIFIRAPNNPVQALEDDVMDVFDPVDIINDNDDINKDENDDREAECYPNRGRFLAQSVGSHNMDTNFPSLSMPATNSNTSTTSGELEASTSNTCAATGLMLLAPSASADLESPGASLGKSKGISEFKKIKIN